MNAGCGSREGAARPRASAAARPSLAPELVEIEERTIGQLRAWIDARPRGARELVERYLARIEALDRGGPALHAVVEVNPDATSLADRLDDDRRSGASRGPLHGIPVLVKDNIDTGDRMKTTAGSLALAGAPAKVDAAIVARLRAAGAVILGKTNMSEWANARDRRSTGGWSARGGLTRNPYALDRSASGSSSGSAVAVAANLAAAAIGTETDGSIVSPSSKCGVVGLKPSAGLIPQDGIVPISHNHDTAGPIARTVTDVALVHRVLAGSSTDESPKFHRGAAHGVRIGVRRGMRWPSPAVLASFERALEVLRGLGAELVDPVEIAEPAALDDALTEVLLTDFPTDLERYLARRDIAGIRTLADVVQFDENHRAEELAWFGQDLLEEAVKKSGRVDSDAYRVALATCRRLSRDEGLDAAFAKDGIAVLVAPTSGPAWVIDPITGDHYTGSSSGLPAIAGYPNLTVPCGAVHGLPLGLSLSAPPRAEGQLLAVAFAYEQATHHRAAPEYRLTVLL